MSMVVQHNLTAMFTNRQLKITGGKRSKSAEKLASGYRVNRAADDAAGLSISEKMRKQIRGLTQASANLQDGVSLAQVADGALAEVHEMIHRINDLAVKAANGTMSLDDRDCINDEVQALKREMSRVFKTTKFNDLEIFRTVDTIYNPEIEGYPTDMGVFHKGSGAIGGLEFNNVRYSIAELQEVGLLIDDDGIATQDFEVEFNLWDGEKVKLKMGAGQSLDKAVRNFEWEAKEDGIYINGKLSAEWEEMLVDGKDKVITNIDKLPPGEYSFTHHGMKVIFEVDSELDIDNMKERINGTDEIPPATWDVSVGAPKYPKPADIVDDTAPQTIRVTEANKNVMDHTFIIVANENGLAIRNSTAGTQTSYVSWNTFKDSELASVKDENGNIIPTNGGYPIVDWGTSEGTTGQTSITFDADATYHFTSPDPDIKIEFDFKLADSASLDEVIAALNGTSLGNPSVSSPGNMTCTSGSYGTISYVSRLMTNSFVLQRTYGRNFDNSHATLSGSLNVKRTEKSNQANASDRPTATDGTYQSTDSNGSHTVVRNTVSETLSGTNSTVSDTKYYKEVIDDGNGNLTTKYYRVLTYDVEETYGVSWTAKDSWNQDVDYIFNGNFAGFNLETNHGSRTETWERTLNQSGTKTVTYRRYLTEALSDDYGGEADEVTVGYSNSLDGSTFDRNESGIEGITTNSVGTATMTDISTAANRINVKEAGRGQICSFNYNVTLNQARSLADTSSAVDIGTFTFIANGYASRKFVPNENPISIYEAQFSNVNVNDVHVEIPPRSLRIQSGADSDDKIEMVWTPLNLSQLSMYSTKTLTMEQAERAIDQTAQALQVITETRMLFGAYQNRFEHAIKMTDNTVENTTYAESMIRDTDMAKEMVQYSNVDIIAQAGQAMLAQANQSNQGVLALLS